MLDLIGDLNWPVHRVALSTLFGLDSSAILTTINDAVYEERFRELDALCWHLLQEKPAWLPAIQPSLEEVMEKVTYYAHESNIMTLFQQTNNERTKSLINRKKKA